MKKKNIVIAVILVVILALAGWWYFGKQKTVSPAEMMSGGMSDIFGQNVSVQCSYTDEEGREATTYVKNGAVRSDYTGKTDKESGSMIMKDKIVYTWQGKQGYMMQVPEISVTPGETMKQSDEEKTEQEDVKAQIEKYKESCKNATISDDVFTPPADVTFTDYSQMMKDNQKMMQQGTGMSEEQVNQYMEQYNPAQ